jgi:hypothetical protein
LNDYGNFVQIDPSGSIYASGIAKGTCNFGSNTISSTDQFNFIAKYDSNGNNLWATKYDWAGNSPQGNNWYAFFFNDFKVSRSGNAVMVGTLNDNSLEWGDVAVFDSTGAVAFTYLVPVASQITNADFDSSGNFFVSGSYINPGSFFAKFSPTAQLWNINFTNSMGLSIKVTPDNGLLVEGIFTDSLNVPDHYSNTTTLYATQGILGTDRFFAKYTNDGHLLWAHNYNESLKQANIAIDPANNSVYFLTLDNNYYYMECIDSSGNELWNNQITSYDNANGPWTPHIFVSNSKVYVVGPGADIYAPAPYNLTIGTFFLARYDLNGNLTGQITPQTTNVSVYGGDIAIANNSIILTGGILGAGMWGNDSVTSKGSADFFLAKMAENNFDAANGVKTVEAAEGIKIYPNPSSGGFYVNFENVTNAQVEILITDVVGRNIYTETFQSTIGMVNHYVRTKNLDPGMYAVTLNPNGKSINTKIIIQ